MRWRWLSKGKVTEGVDRSQKDDVCALGCGCYAWNETDDVGLSEGEDRQTDKVRRIASTTTTTEEITLHHDANNHSQNKEPEILQLESQKGLRIDWDGSDDDSDRKLNYISCILLLKTV